LQYRLTNYSLRAPEVIPKTTQLTCRYMNNDRKPFITFKFKYRSKGM